MIGRLQGALVRRARAEVRHRQVEEVDESAQPAFEGHVLTERHQALLVVLPAALAQGHGGIVVAALLIAGGNAGNQRRVAEIRAPVYACEKIARLIEDPRYGGLGPQHQIALEAGPYGLFIAGQYLPVIASIPLFLQRNIGLIHRDRQRPFGGRRHPFDGAQHKPAAPEHGEQAGVADQGRRLTAAPGQEQAGGAEHHREGQPEYPGDRRPSRQPGIGVGVAQVQPGKARQQPASQPFTQHPERGKAQQHAAGKRADEARIHPGLHGVQQRETRAEQQGQQRRQGHGGVAVHVYADVHPRGAAAEQPHPEQPASPQRLARAAQDQQIGVDRAAEDGRGPQLEGGQGQGEQRAARRRQQQHLPARQGADSALPRGAHSAPGGCRRRLWILR